MASGKKVIWTFRAREERKEILTYWTKRNKSNRYSVKLRELITEQMLFIAEHPEKGRPTEFESVKYVLVRDYQIFFEETKNEILILSIWDARQAPERLKKRLE